jgi:ankyrin repeat protein
VVRLLVSRGADLEATDAHTAGTPLVWAALGRGTSALGELLDLGADPAAANCWGETALVLAVRAGRADAVGCLLVAGASPKAGWQGRSLLEIAVARGHGEVALLLRGARQRTARPR